MRRDPDPDVALYYRMAREQLAAARDCLEISVFMPPETERRPPILHRAVFHLMTAHVDREEARALRRKRYAGLA